MPTLYYITLFLAFASAFTNTSIDAAPSRVTIGVQTIVETTGLVHFSCDSVTFDLPRNQIREWNIPSNRAEHCFARWNNLTAAFNGYDVDSDKGHFAVHWLVEEEGFYHSQDNLLNWKLKAQWTQCPIVQC